MTPQQLQETAQKAVESLDQAGKLAHWPETEAKKIEAAAIIARHFESVETLKPTNEALEEKAKNLANDICPGYWEARRKYDAIAMPTSLDWSDLLGEVSANRDKMASKILRVLEEVESAASQPTSMEDELAECVRELTKVGTPMLGTEKLKAIDILARYDAQKGQR